LIVRSLGVAVLLVGTSPVFGPVVPVSSTRVPEARRVFWIDGTPADDAERRLHEALRADAATASGRAAVQEVARAHAGTPVGGLAHLALGLALLDADRAEDALGPLSHPDIDHTGLEDHALLARARANEAEGRYHAATEAYAALARMGGDSPLRCTARLRAAEVMTLVGRTDEALAILREVPSPCSGQEPQVLQLVAHAHERAGHLAAAAEAMDALIAEFPLSDAAKEEAAHLKKLAAHRPAVPAAKRLARETRRGLALLEAGRTREAAAALRSALAAGAAGETADLVRVRLGGALTDLAADKEATAALTAVTSASPHAAEAAYHLARIASRRARSSMPFVAVADRFKGSPWAEEALLDVAHSYQKDGRDAEAAPWFRRMADEHPRGRHGDAAMWRAGWDEYRAGRYDDAAARFEKAARERPPSSYTSGFLYWAARARKEKGDDGRARELLEETVRRFKHTYHGQRAAEVLGPERAAAVEPEPVAVEDPGLALTPAQAARVHRLLLIGRLDEAAADLEGLPPAPEAQATRAWIHHRQGRLRAAINTMRRAYPESAGVAGDDLPREVWEILYPLQFGDALAAEADEAGLDPALVAALIWQESTFDPQAVSGAGARGLMQLMPRTGRELARKAGIRKFTVSTLHDPRHGLLLGTRYLKGMIDSFGGRLERALAAYNAGPGRVETWNRARGRQTPEEFIETIPFQETRRYVMNVLANREHYRRLYGLGARSAPTRERMAPDD
jgi:soluble lytic murein transglycosylase